MARQVPYGAFNFIVNFAGSEAFGGFSDVSGIGSEITVAEYRYGNDKSEDELEALLLADTMRELVSYAVGCMFGRYSLDAPGLILANQGETVAEYIHKVTSPTVIPRSPEESRRIS